MAAPGGWLTLLAIRATKALVVGSIVAGGGSSLVYGTQQGAQASHFIEAPVPSAAKNTVALSVLNPVQNNMSGAIKSLDTNGLMLVKVPSPATKLLVCTAALPTTACEGTAAGANVMSGVALIGPKNRWMAMSGTGGSTLSAPIILGPRNAAGSKRYLNFTFVNGSGQTVGAVAPVNVKFEIQPCNPTATSQAGC